MLQNLRDNSRGVISFILIGLLVIIFALTGAEALFNWDASSNKAVKVNGESITQLEVSRAINNQKQQMLNLYGDQIPSEFLTDEYLRQPVVDNLVKRKIMSQYAEAAKMRVSENTINTQIASVPGFRTEQGTFDNTRYQQFLMNTAQTHSGFVKQLNDDLIVGQLQSGIARSGFSTEQQVNDVVALSFQTRDFSFIELSAEKVRSTVSVSEEDIQKYYDNNKELFRSDEQVAVDYINLTTADFVNDITVDESQVRAQYEQNLKQFVSAPEREVAHILIEDNSSEKIEAVKQGLAAGKTFEELAAQFSDDLGSKEQGGNIGTTQGDSFPSDFEAIVATLDVGAVSEPTKTDAGTHFVKVIAERGAEPESFEDQKVAIENQLKRSLAESRFVELLERLKDLSYNAENLADVANELGLSVNNSGLFEKNKGVGIFSNTNVMNAAFSPEVVQDGNSSDVIEIDSTNVVVLKKTDYKPAQVKPLDVVSEQISNVLKEQQVRALLGAEAEKIQARLKAGESLESVASELSLEVKTFEASARSNAEVDSTVLQHVFRMPKPSDNAQSYSATSTNSGNLAVVALTKVSAGTLDNLAQEQRAAVMAQLSDIYGRSDYAAYEASVRSKAKVE